MELAGASLAADECSLPFQARLLPFPMQSAVGRAVGSIQLEAKKAQKSNRGRSKISEQIG